MKSRRLCLLVVLTTNFATVWAGWDNILLTTQSFKNCDLNMTYANPVVDIHMHKDGVSETLYISSALNVTEYFGEGGYAEIDCLKCIKGSNGAEGCTLFHRFKCDFCHEILKKGAPWTPWMEAIKGFGPCPIQPKLYPMPDLQFNFNVNGPWRVMIKPEQYIGHWRMQSKFIYGNIKTCFELEGDVKKKRRQTKKKIVPGIDALDGLPGP